MTTLKLVASKLRAFLVREFRSYDGLKTLVVLMGGVVGVLVLNALRVAGLAKTTILGEPAFLRYCWAFWTARTAAVLFGLGVVIVVLTADLGPRWYHLFFKSLPLRERDRRARQKRQALRWVVGGPLVFLTFTVIPLLYLRFPSWLPWLIAVLPFPLTLLSYAGLFGFQFSELKQLKPLSKLTFATKSWNVAGIGVGSSEADAEVEAYREACREGPMSEAAKHFVLHGAEGTRWKGNSQFISLIGEVLGVDGARVRLFDRTTDAIRHALEELRTRARKTDDTDKAWEVVTTDAEYNSVWTILKDHKKTGLFRVRRAKVAQSIWRGAPEEEIVRRIVEEISESTRVVLVSHVFFESGFELPLAKVVEAARSKVGGGFPVFVIDGAQAVGNVAVDHEVMSSLGYYAGCGHKWLGAGQTLGFLYTNPGADCAGEERRNTRGLSRYDDEDASGTVNLVPHIELNVSLQDLLQCGPKEVAERNQLLAEKLTGLVAADGIMRPVRSRPTNGIVTLEGREAQELHQGLLRGGIESTLFLKKGALRLCCHYYQSENDVHELIGKMLRVLEG